MIVRTLQIASKSLTTQQQAMDTVSQNISNVNTEGYSRQTANLTSAQPDLIRQFSFGNGVELAGISRSMDPLVANAQITNNSLSAFANTVKDGLTSVEATFGNLGAPGLTSTLDAFFTAQQLLANSPDDPITRRDMIAKANDFANLASSMQQQLVSRQQSADQEVAAQIKDVNILLDKVAQLNQQIVRSETSSQVVGSANDLRDQRDLAIKQLATIIPVQQVDTKDGGMMLQTPGGDLLIQDAMVRHLQVGAMPGSSYSQVQFTDSGQPATGIESGGTIGGLITIRDNKLSGYINTLDSLARNFIFSVNQLHAGGTGTTAVTSYTSAQTAVNPAAAVDTDTSIPFASKIAAGSFTVHVIDGNPPTNPGGVAINITPGVTTLNQIATDISAIAGVTATVDANGALVINGGANRVAFSNDTSNFLAAYEINSFFHGSGAADIAIDAAVLSDPGRIATATPDAATSAIAINDNSTALGILALRDQALNVDGGTSDTLINRAANLAGQFGLDIAAATQESVFRDSQATSLAAQRAAVSGVNLDEELVNMMIFQRSYEASAKVIQTANEMLATLMGILR